MIRFAHTQWVHELERLSPRLRAVFATACAERLMPGFLATPAEERALRDMRGHLSRLWHDLVDESLEQTQVRWMIDRCMVLLADDTGIWRHADAFATEGVGLTLTYALRCRENGEAQEAAWSAQCAYEALLGRRASHEARCGMLDDRDVASSDVQIELARQRRDMGNLQGVGASDVRGAIQRIRTRAEQERRMGHVSVHAMATGA